MEEDGRDIAGEREALWKAGVEVVRQVGSFRPQAISPTEWNTIWHQLPCRLRVYAAQIEEEWQRAMPLEYGTGPAELQALQEMAAQWRQDIQHGRRQGDHSAAEVVITVAPRGMRVRQNRPLTMQSASMSRKNAGAW